MTRLFGIIGYPIEHSFSPLMHAAAIRALGLDAVYAPFAIPPREVARVLTGLQRAGVDGLNVTVPHKEAAARFVQRHGRLSAEARAIGAVNTLVRVRNQFRGENTDVVGVREVLQRELRCRPHSIRTVLVLGAGGAARAALWALQAWRPEMIYVVNRTPARARLLARWWNRVGATPPLTVVSMRLDALVSLARAADVVINATSVGLHRKDAPLLPAQAWHSRSRLFDLVYRPPTTALVRRARRRGALAVDGIPMLVYQGAESFRMWWHRPPPVDVMRRAVEKAHKNSP